MNEYWAQINENENWTEGKLETQKYAKTVSLFSALSVITSKPAKTWRVYHSDTKKKTKKKTNQWNVISILYIVTNRVHRCTIPKSEDAVADLRFCAKGHHLTYFTPGKVMMIIRKTSHKAVSIQFLGDHIDTFFFCPCPIATKFSPVIEVCQNAVFSKIDVTMTTKTKNFVINKIRLINFFAI